MSTITIKEFKALAKAGRVGNKRKGDNAKATINSYLKKWYGDQLQAEHKFCTRKFKFDYALLQAKIAIEYEGLMSEKSRHTTIRGYATDCEKYNLAVANGWRVLRYTAVNWKDFSRDISRVLSNDSDLPF